MTAPPRCTVVTVAARPDLAPVAARWIWEAFWKAGGTPLAVVRARVAEAEAVAALPQCFVLLADDVPVGTASLVAHDLDVRPDLTPWLAAVVVDPDHRGRGHAAPLVRAVEAAAHAAGFAPLWLYTRTAEPLYARLGWRTVDRFDHEGQAHALMRRRP